MAEIKKEVQRFQNKESPIIINVKKEADDSVSEVKQEILPDVIANVEDLNTSLVKIKTELDYDYASSINSMHHEVSSFDASAVKEEIDSDTEISNYNSVTVNLLIPETILYENTEIDKQTNSKGNFANSNSIPSSEHSGLTMIQGSIQSNVSSNIMPDNIQSVAIESKLNEIVEESQVPVKKRRRQKRSSNKSIDVWGFDIIDLCTAPQSSTEISEMVLQSQPEENRKDGNKKTTDIGKRNWKGKETIVCPFCDRKMRKSYFPYHARLHTDEKPFKCPKCPYTSHFQTSLDFHINSHHPTESYLIPPKQ